MAAIYIRSKSKNPEQIDAFSFMPHEKKTQQTEMSLEEYMMQNFGEGS